jgi:osmotically-inducible protein OsmY
MSWNRRNGILVADLRKPSVNVRAGEIPSRIEKELAEATAHAVLRRARSGELRSVTCHFHEGVLTLRGRVQSYYMKQMAQELVRPVQAVQQVNNRLQVVSSARNT